MALLVAAVELAAPMASSSASASAARDSATRMSTIPSGPTVSPYAAPAPSCDVSAGMPAAANRSLMMAAWPGPAVV
jgi:hypothetical protein